MKYIAKKQHIAALAAAAVLSGMSAFAADNEPSVYLNGEKLTFDVNPYIENDRTLVPMRAIFEAVGATVEWDADNRTVYAIRNKDGETRLVTLQIDNNTAYANGEAEELDVAALIKDDRTFVPLRFVIEALGEKVEWDGDNYSVVITTD